VCRDALDDVEVATSIPAFGGDRLRDLRGRLDAAEDVQLRGKRQLREVEEQVAAELTFIACQGPPGSERQ
jgi:hypothetical protein